MKLSPTVEQFVLHWGEMGNKWGVNRTVSQIHALLYLVEKPMNAEEIVETLGVARSNVSNSIKELQQLKMVHTVHIMGDRRDHFSTSKDIWALAKIIAEERYRRELEPTVDFLERLLDSPEYAEESTAIKKQIKETHEFVNTLSVWSAEMIKLSNKTLSRIMRLGTNIQKFLK